jgi:hypothetical protein
MVNGSIEVTGMGTGSNIHQMTHIMATAAVMASAVLSAAAEVFISRKYISSANSGPANKAMVFVVTLLSPMFEF